MPLADMPQSNTQHAVPQNVMNVEFKLIGDLTMRQFAYVFIAGILAYISYVIFIGIFRWPLTISVGMLGIGLAFVPVQERGMDEWIVNFVKSMFKPTQRYWKKEPTVPSAFMYDSLAMVRQELITLAPTSSRRKLEEYLSYHDEKEKLDPLDIPEKKYAQMVLDALPAKKRGAKTVSTYTDVSINPPETSTSEELKVEQTAAVETSPEPVIAAPVIQNESEITESDLVVSETQPTITPASVPSQNIPIEKRKDAGLFHLFKAKEAQKAREDYRAASIRKGEIPAKISEKRSSQDLTLSPMTPDMHSGRRFINLLPSGGELVLPIRGERVLKTSEQLSVEESINEKAEKLQELLKRIKEGEGIKIEKKTNIIPIPPIPVVQKKEQQAQEVHDEAKNVANILKTQSEELNEEIVKIKKNIQSTASPGVSSSATGTQERLLQDLESKQHAVEENYRVISRGIQNLKGDYSLVPEIDSSVATASDVFNTRVKPNTIHGIVKDKEGKVLTDALLIIKNSQDEPVRALKTDSLGRFELLTALSDGKYIIEVKPGEDLKLSFDKISVELKGEVIPPLVILGKQ